MEKKKIVLASASPRREKLLRLTGLDFIVDKNCMEPKISEVNREPEQVPITIAYQKALSVYPRYQDDEFIVIGADTIIALDDELIGKPKDKEEAVRILSRLSGREHRVITGVSIGITSLPGHFKEGYCETRVHICPVSSEFIQEYVHTRNTLGWAGAYAIQEDAFFVERVEGDYQNVMGLPLGLVKNLLGKYGVKTR